MTTQSITQFDITFTFDKEYEFGKFADGSYWVLGPVTIVSISPDFVDGKNGWQVNPEVKDPQGFTNDTHFYDPSLVPALPYTAATTQSIVKVISGAYRHTKIKTAVVLTVVTEIPLENGAAVFRPPYLGTAKPMYKVSDLQTHLLPSFPHIDGAPTLDSIVAKFSQCLRMDHLPTYPRFFRPSDSLWDYQPGNINDVADAMLRLMLNDPIAQKLPALIQLTQPCIDRLYAMMLGYRTGSTGHNPGHRTMAAWAAVMLNIPEGKDYLKSSTSQNYQELQFLVKRGERTLWGQNASEWDYWKYLQGLGGNQSNADPYNYIDGGNLVTTGAGGAGGAYQKIVSQNLKAGALISILIPEMEITWRPGHGELVKEYSDRWVNHGVWAEPDPVAPYTSDGVYKVTYGPDPANPGQAILGAGRFPGLHGLNKDGGQYKSGFVAAMWNAYRNTVQEPPTPVELPPVITAQPQNITAEEGGDAVFVVVATGNGTLLYQWSQNGEIIEGATSSELALSSISLADAGDYTVTVSNLGGSVESVVASLTVNVLPPPPQPTNTIYIAQTQLGNGDGLSAQNAKSVDFFNDPLNWSSTNNTSSDVGKICPGVTVIITGIISTSLTFQRGGLEGAPITLLFDKDAKFSSPYISTAIKATSKNYFIIDGGENGIIENTDNGTLGSFTHNSGSILILLETCSYCDIKNLTIQNAYVRTDTADTQWGGAGIKIMPRTNTDVYSHVRVLNCVVSDVQDGIYFMYRPSGPNNLEVSGNTVFNINHGIKFGDGGINSRLDDVVIKNNKVYGFSKWDEPATNKFHHDGIFVFASNSGSQVHNVTIANNILGPDYGRHSTAGVYLSGWIFNALIKNNRFFSAGANGSLALRLRDQSTAQVHNNVFSSSSPLYNSAIYFNGQDGGLKYVHCRNNIFFTLRTPYNVSFSGAWSLDIDYSWMFNVHAIQTLSYSSTSTGSFRTFAKWQEMGFDLNGRYEVNPLLDAEDKLLEGSPAIGAGENLSAVFTDDAAGLTRTNPWDVGMYKYTGIVTEPKPYAPVITKQPIGANIKVGESVIFNVTAIGDPLPSYQWRKDEVDLDGEMDSSLTVGFATLEDSGDYDVIVTNSEGSAQSNSVVLTVEEPLPEEFAPEITLQPTSVSVNEGESVSLTIAATGNPEPTCTWYKDGVQIPGSNSFTLNISSVTAGDGGSYYAIVSNSQGNVISNIVEITVVSLPVEELAIITKQPIGQSVSEGADVTFTVVATSSSPMTYQWDRNGNILAGKTHSSLMLNDVKVGDTGTYSVTITNAAGAIISDGAALTVSPAQTPPVITVHPVSKIARMKDTVVFSVVAQANPAPTYQWYKNGFLIPGAVSTSFFISNVKKSDEGVYTVTASNPLGVSTSEDALLTVRTGK